MSEKPRQLSVPTRAQYVPDHRIDPVIRKLDHNFVA
jgi:hypothetical protein